MTGNDRRTEILVARQILDVGRHEVAQRAPFQLLGRITDETGELVVEIDDPLLGIDRQHDLLRLYALDELLVQRQLGVFLLQLLLQLVTEHVPSPSSPLPVNGRPANQSRPASTQA